MKPIFTKGPSYSVRLAIVLVFAIFLFFADSKFNLFSSVRVYLNSFVSPIQYIAYSPQRLAKVISQNILTRKELQKRNYDLEKKNLVLSADKQFLLQLQNENKTLRSLLNSKKTFINKRMITEVMRVRSDPFTHQVLINKGKNNGVYIGQPVTSTLGVVGQISQVGNTTSRVLLIVDASHGLPVRDRRNGLIANVHGSGEWNRLDIPFIQRTADLKVGDILETSGLGGVFPAGYPVARVSHFSYVKGALFADASATPIAKIDKSRYLLLLWPDKNNVEKKVSLSDAKLP